jgi:cardiolipin synthase
VAIRSKGEVASPEYELLVGAEQFWHRASGDMAAASRRLFVQAMTFEGDAAGKAVAAAIRDSNAKDRRVLVDHYTSTVINDRFLFARRLARDVPILEEARQTDEMFAGLIAAGVGVRATNPVGPLLTRYGLRNHKKLIVADDIAYLGGFNFSDHNFAWLDLMLRIEGAEPANFLAADFAATWESRPAFSQREEDGLRLYALDGRTNAAGYADLMTALAAAVETVDVISPYLTFPFVEALQAAALRGVAVRFVTPAENNKPMIRHYLSDAMLRTGFEVRHRPGMSHVKAMLIDGRTLVLGSSNFDFVSYHGSGELLAMIEDAGLIADFRARVLDPALEGSTRFTGPRSPWWHVARSRFVFAAGRVAIGAMKGFPRNSTEWR